MNLLEKAEIPRALDVTINDDEVTVVLSGTAMEGAKLVFPARALKPLQDATEDQLNDVSIIHDGGLLYWRSLDSEFRVSKLIEQVTGIQSLKAAQVKGGRVVSEAKAAAVRANGAKGGRPRKKAN